ncbi:ketosteroid isomerase family protein [Mycobacterium sp. 1274761.0]|uniref:ketosteroid isomerase family protein n=1 Tax=Mycobacterium sp. 1274761.0 TaxID=1834077 RepID=UPI0007FC0635|nr:ketosteroid isomerase family protein [Mycobacterium sp. 1274761.0]OBK74096.1 transporter [Mycobacterium sp. 1274761.0]
MAAIDVELLAAVERSPAATDVHDRTGWIGIFTPHGRVEDPYGSRPHVGVDEIGRFYDTFIGPRQIIFHRDVDVAVGSAVVRDLMLEIVMAAGVTVDVPMHLRYDLRPVEGDWAVERLRAHWELPTMVAQMLRQGGKSLPVAVQLAGELLRNQGIGGTAGFAAGFRRPGRRDKRRFAEFLDAAIAGDQLAVRRAIGRGADVSLGEDQPIAVGDFVDSLRGGRWFKMIAAGDTVSASVAAPSGRGVVFCETPKAAGISRVRYFG